MSFSTQYNKNKSNVNTGNSSFTSKYNASKVKKPSNNIGDINGIKVDIDAQVQRDYGVDISGATVITPKPITYEDILSNQRKEIFKPGGLKNQVMQNANTAIARFAQNSNKNKFEDIAPITPKPVKQYEVMTPTEKLQARDMAGAPSTIQAQYEEKQRIENINKTGKTPAQTFPDEYYEKATTGVNLPVATKPNTPNPAYSYYTNPQTNMGFFEKGTALVTGENEIPKGFQTPLIAYITDKDSPFYGEKIVVVAEGKNKFYYNTEPDNEYSLMWNRDIRTVDKNKLTFIPDEQLIKESQEIASKKNAEEQKLLLATQEKFDKLPMVDKVQEIFGLAARMAVFGKAAEPEAKINYTTGNKVKDWLLNAAGSVVGYMVPIPGAGGLSIGSGINKFMGTIVPNPIGATLSPVKVLIQAAKKGPFYGAIYNAYGGVMIDRPTKDIIKEMPKSIVYATAISIGFAGLGLLYRAYIGPAIQKGQTAIHLRFSEFKNRNIRDLVPFENIIPTSTEKFTPAILKSRGYELVRGDELRGIWHKLNYDVWGNYTGEDIIYTKVFINNEWILMSDALRDYPGYFKPYTSTTTPVTPTAGVGVETPINGTPIINNNVQFGGETVTPAANTVMSPNGIVQNNIGTIPNTATATGVIAASVANTNVQPNITQPSITQPSGKAVTPTAPQQVVQSNVTTPASPVDKIVTIPTATPQTIAGNVQPIKGITTPTTATVNTIPKEVVQAMPNANVIPIAPTVTNANMSSNPKIANAISGNTGIVKDSTGKKYKFIYKIVDNSDLITSHDVDMNINPAYPEEKQPRERDRTAYKLQVIYLTKKLDPEQLGENILLTDGAPIIDENGAVESGNGRTLALRMIYANSNNPKGAEYRNWLIDNADRFGIDASNLPQNPQLVRERITPVDDIRAYVRDANIPTVAERSASEIAKDDASQLTSRTLESFIPNENGAINTANNRDFIRQFVREIIPQNSLGKYVIADGTTLSQDGVLRIKNAIFYKAYGNTELLSMIAESLDNNIKNITNGMIALAPRFIAITEQIENGSLHNLDYSKQFASAVKLYVDIKKKGQSVDEYLAQPNVFGEEVSPLAQDLMLIIERYSKLPTGIPGFFKELFDSIEKLGDPRQPDILGTTTKYDRISLLEEAYRRYENVRANAKEEEPISLFETKPEESRIDTPDTGNKGQGSVAEKTEVNPAAIEPTEPEQQTFEETVSGNEEETEMAEYQKPGDRKSYPTDHIFSAQELHEFNTFLVNGGMPDSYDEQGYSKLDYQFMNNLMRAYNANGTLSNKQLAAMSKVLKKYGNTQLGISPELFNKATDFYLGEQKVIEEKNFKKNENLPELTGSDKQIHWAKGIRNRLAEKMDAFLADKINDSNYMKYAEGYGKFLAMDKARDFIDLNNANVEDLLTDYANGINRFAEPGGIKNENGEVTESKSGRITGLNNRFPLEDTTGVEENGLITTRGGKVTPETEIVSEKARQVLMAHQIDGVNLAVTAMDAYGGFVLADGTGSGKTLIELETAVHYISNGNTVLLVTTNDGNITNTFVKQSKMIDAPLNITKDNGTIVKNKINVTTYSSLDKIKSPVDYVIFDESHNLKNRGANKTKIGLRLAEKSKGVMFASATPMDKAAHIHYLKKAGIFSKNSFSKVMQGLGYEYEEKTIRGQVIGNYVRRVPLEEAEANFSELFDELSSLGLIIKREVPMDKVDIYYETVPLDSKALDALDRIESYYAGDDGEVKGLFRVLAIMAQRRFQESYKIEPTLNITRKELAAGRQVVIFATRINDTELETNDILSYDETTGEMVKDSLIGEGTLTKITNELESAGIKVSKIFGNKSVDKEVEKFQNGETSVAIVTPQKGGAGLSLDDTVGDKPRTMIIITPPFSGVDNVQMAGRINRLKTKSKGKLIYLFADTAVDDWNKAIITEKMKTLNAAVKGDIGKLDLDNIDSKDDYDSKVQTLADVQPKAVSGKKVLSSNSSTGEVYRFGDMVYKNSTFKNGTKTLEGEIYSAMKDVEGIAPGYTTVLEGKEYIATPYYENVLSVDTVKKADRPKFSVLVMKNQERINRVINELSNREYDYSDPLQFGYKNGKLYLLDFSNASKGLDSAYLTMRNNYGYLSAFYNQFGLENIGKIIDNAMQTIGYLDAFREDGEALASPEDTELYTNLLKQSDIKINNIYYATNARPIELKVDHIETQFNGMAKYIITEKPLTEKQLSDWELTPVYEKPAVLVKPANKVNEPAAKSDTVLSSTGVADMLNRIKIASINHENLLASWVYDAIEYYIKTGRSNSDWEIALNNVSDIDAMITSVLKGDTSTTGIIKSVTNYSKRNSSKELKNEPKEIANERTDSDMLGRDRTAESGELATQREALENVVKRLRQDGMPDFVATISPAKTLEQRQVSELLKGLGIEVIYYESKSDIPLNDFYNPILSDKVFINTSTPRTMLWSVGHGFFHTLKQNHTDLYKQIIDIFKGIITPEQKLQYLSRFDSTPQHQKDLINDENSLIEEMLSDESGNAFTDKNFWQKVWDKSKELFEKLVQIVKDLFAKIKKVQAPNYLTQQQVDKFNDEFANIVKTVRERAGQGAVAENVVAPVGVSAETVAPTQAAEPKPQMEATPYSMKNDIENINKFVSDFYRGEKLTFDEVITNARYVLDNKDTILRELKSLTIAELKQITGLRAYVKTKDEFVKAAYSDMLSGLYHNIADTDTFSYDFSFGKSYTDVMAEQIETILKDMTPEKLDKILASKKEKYEIRKREREQKIDTIKKPETLEDYQEAKRYRKLNAEEQVKYENLLALNDKKVSADKTVSDKTAKVDNAITELSNTNYTVNKSKHSKTGEDIWVVKVPGRLEKEVWQKLNSAMKSLGGNYWSGNQGWNFKNDPTKALSGNMPTVAKSETVASKTPSEKLRQIADNMQAPIDALNAPRLSNTAKRARQAASAEDEAREMQRLQTTMRNIADAMDNGSLKLLTDLDSRAQIMTLDKILSTAKYYIDKASQKTLTYAERLAGQDKPYSYDDVKVAALPTHTIPIEQISKLSLDLKSKQGYVQLSQKLNKLVADNNGFVNFDNLMDAVEKALDTFSDYEYKYLKESIADTNRLNKMGIKSDEHLRAYLREYLGVRANIGEKTKLDLIKEKQRSLVGRKLEGYFPTPAKVVNEMLRVANIQKSDSVLEPSAGQGHIADKVKEYTDNIDVAELDTTNREILELKDYNIVSNDALKITGQYDKVLMNPPFEKNQDISHVMYAFENNLKEGGRLVAIMSEHPFFANDKASVAFREFVDKYGYSEKLAEGSFKESDVSTGVNSRMVVLDKPETKLSTGEVTDNYEGQPKYSLGNIDDRTPDYSKTGEQELSQFYANSILNAQFIPEDVKGVLEEIKFMYDKESNEGQLQTAIENINRDMAKVVSELENADSLQDGVMAAEAILITKVYLAEGNAIDPTYSKLKAWLEKFRTKVTPTAQALQALSMMKKMTAEATLMKASEVIAKQRTIRQEKAITNTAKELEKGFKEIEKPIANEIANEVKKKANSVIREGIARGILDLDDEIPNVTQVDIDNVTQEDIDKKNPVELLMAKIESALKDPKAKESDFITKMVNELFRVANESPLPTHTQVATNPLDFIKEAIQNRQEYKDVWLEAKSNLMDKYKDVPEVMDMLSEYFEKGIKPTFSKATLDRAIGKYIAGFKKASPLLPSTITKLGDIVRDYYATGKGKIDDMIKRMVEETGLTGDEAKTLVKYVRNRVQEMTKAKKDELLASMFKETPPTKSEPLKAIKEMANLGAFDNAKYREAAIRKLDSSLSGFIRKSGIDLGKIARASVDVAGLNKIKLQKLISEQLQVGDRELKQVVELVGKTFDKLLGEKKQAILNNMLKEKKQAEKRTFYDKFVELYNLTDGFGDMRSRDYIAQKLNVPFLSDETVKSIIDLTKVLADTPKTGMDNLIYRQQIMARIVSVIDNLQDAGILKKISTFQAIQQLLSIKGPERNFIGNELSSISENGSKFILSLADFARSAITGKDRAITYRTGINFIQRIKDYIADYVKSTKAAWGGYELFGLNKSQEERYITASSKSFTGKYNPYNYLERVTKAVMSDYAAYMKALREYLGNVAILDGLKKHLHGKALKENAQNYLDNLSEETFKEAQKYAERLTFRGESKTADIGMEAKRLLNAYQKWGLGDVFIKYIRTQMMLYVRGLEFSPFGAINSLWHASHAVVNQLGLVTSEKAQSGHWKKAAEALVRAIFGSIMFGGLGYLLAKKGIIKGAGKADTDAGIKEVKKEVGIGQYQVNVTALMRWFASGFKDEAAIYQDGDKSYTYAWLQPIATSIAIGANFAETQKGNVGNVSQDLVDSLLATLEGTLSIMQENPLAAGLKKLFASWNKYETLETILTSIMTGFTGTLNNQIRQLIDNKVRVTKDDRFVIELLNIIKNKLPILSETLPADISITGEEKEIYQDGSNSAFNVFLNPAFVTKYNPSPGLQLVLDIYSKTGDATVAPREAPVSVTLPGTGLKATLTAAEQREFLAELGKLTVAALDEFATSRVIISRKGYILVPDNASEEDEIDAIVDMMDFYSDTIREKWIAKFMQEGRFK